MVSNITPTAPLRPDWAIEDEPVDPNWFENGVLYRGAPHTFGRTSVHRERLDGDGEAGPHDIVITTATRDYPEGETFTLPLASVGELWVLFGKLLADVDGIDGAHDALRLMDARDRMDDPVPRELRRDLEVDEQLRDLEN